MCSLSSGPETVQEHCLSSPSRFDGSPGLQRCKKNRRSPISLEYEKQMICTHPIKRVSLSGADAYSIALWQKIEEFYTNQENVFGANEIL